jgi:hypothetical protein
MSKKIIILLVIILIGFPSVHPLKAKTLKGITMEDSIEINGEKLVLNGMALRKKVIFKVYVAGLYLPQKEQDAEKILTGNTTRHIIMHFMRSVSKSKLNGAWFDGLESNTPKHSPELKKQFDTLASLMEGVKKGDRIIFTYTPDKGTDVNVKNNLKGTIAGKEFADALFACWIGPKPGPGKGFKEDILGIE